MDTVLDLTSPEANPKLLSLLPLVYVAWSDGVLDSNEIASICETLECQKWLDSDEKKILNSWLDPSNPPSATQYHQWLQTIRTASKDVPEASRKSLADLGIKMASLSATRAPGLQANPEAHRALVDLEEALGIIGPDVASELLDDRPSEALEATANEASFDPTRLQAILDGDQKEIRDKVRKIISQDHFDYVYDERKEDQRERVLDWAKELAAEGIGALAYPVEAGGGGDMPAFIAAFETLAFHDQSLVIKFGVQFGLFGGSIHQLGTEKHHMKYLPDAGSLDLPGCFAMSELGHGSNVRDVQTVAKYDPETEGFYINTLTDNDHKEWIGNAAAHGRLATVFTQLETNGEAHGVHAILVPIRNEDGSFPKGIRIEETGYKMGLNGVDNGRIWFDNVWVPRDNLLDRFASVAPDGTYSSPIPSPGKRFFTMLGTLVGGRLSIAMSGLSASKTALTIAIKYSERRRQFGPKNRPEVKILDYLTHQRRLFPLLANAYAVDFAMKHITDLYNQGEKHRNEVEALAAGLKSWSTWNTTNTIQICRESCGGQGYRAVNRFKSIKEDTDIFATFEGDNTVLMLQVTKSLLAQYKQQFQDLNFVGILRYLGDDAMTRVTEMNPITSRLTSQDHLRDAEFQLAALKFRAHDLLASAASRLSGRIKGGMDSFDAFVEVQDHLLTLANAHVEHFMLQTFVEGVANAEDPGVKAVLKTLCDLFALSAIERDRGWFLEQGYIEPMKAKAIRTEVNRLLGEVRPDAVALVDSFGIPQAALRAPIVA